MSKEPPALLNNKYLGIKYIIFDGTYFHKNGCLVVFMDALSGKPFYYAYIEKESYYNLLPTLMKLKGFGVNPKAFTLDGHRMVIKAILETWPNVLIQRCLFHIERQGLQWLRSFTITQAGKDLRIILKYSGSMRTKENMLSFLVCYKRWRNQYHSFVSSLPIVSSANRDIKRTMALIDNALKDMFHFVKDQNIPPTSNLLEGFFSQLKHQYRNHRGLSENHKISYLKWFCYFKTIKNSNTF